MPRATPRPALLRSALIGLLGGLPMPSVVVALALCGGLIGFAPFNRPVARIFLGDVGSLPIGLVFAWLLVQVAGHGHLIAALVLPLYYLADSTITLLRRVANRKPFWQAHRTHFYQRATNHGFSVREIIARVFVVNVGDILMRWTNDLWVSTPHRVANPPAGWGARRLSVPFFFQANYDTIVECLPTCQGPGRTAQYPPATYREMRGWYYGE